MRPPRLALDDPLPLSDVRAQSHVEQYGLTMLVGPPSLVVVQAPHVWIPKLTYVQFQRGLTRELQEQSAETSYQTMMAPPCPGCGQAVSDAEWERHKYERHALNEMVQPHGTPDAREALFLGGSPEKIEERMAVWRRKHPGCRLALLGEGHELRGEKTRILWRRFRILTAQGRSAA